MLTIADGHPKRKTDSVYLGNGWAVYKVDISYVNGQDTDRRTDKVFHINGCTLFTKAEISLYAKIIKCVDQT